MSRTSFTRSVDMRVTSRVSTKSQSRGGPRHRARLGGFADGPGPGAAGNHAAVTGPPTYNGEPRPAVRSFDRAQKPTPASGREAAGRGHRLAGFQDAQLF